MNLRYLIETHINDQNYCLFVLNGTLVFLKQMHMSRVDAVRFIQLSTVKILCSG